MTNTENTLAKVIADLKKYLALGAEVSKLTGAMIAFGNAKQYVRFDAARELRKTASREETLAFVALRADGYLTRGGSSAWEVLQTLERA